MHFIAFYCVYWDGEILGILFLSQKCLSLTFPRPPRRAARLQTPILGDDGRRGNDMFSNNLLPLTGTSQLLDFPDGVEP